MSINDETPNPKWLDNNFIITCIRKSRNFKENKFIHIDNTVIQYALPKGENFLSIIYRLSVVFRIETEQDTLENTYIVKFVNVEGGGSLPKLIFEKEIDMYHNILPTLQRILERNGLWTNLSCRCIHYECDDNMILVLEDMKERGFVMCDRLIGLDLEHCKLVLQKLSRIHAASMCHFHDKEETVKKDYTVAVFERPENEKIASSMEEMAKQNCNFIIEYLSGYENYRHAVEFLTKYKNVLHLVKNNGVLNFEKGNKFNAINHGDCWVNNLMFKYDKNDALEDAIFIDFQECSYSSVANDFSTFFFTSANEEVMKNNFKDLQQYYLESLVLNLKQLGYQADLPTLAEFRNDIRKNLLLVLNVMTVFCPMAFMKLDEKMQGRSETEALTMKEIKDIVKTMDKYNKFLVISKITIDVLMEEGFLDNAILPEPREWISA